MRQRRLDQPCANPDDPGCACDACRYAEEMDQKGQLKFEPVRLEERRVAPNVELIRMLEDVLEQAKSGELRQVIVAGSLTGGEILRAFSFELTTEANIYHLIGACSVVQQRLLGKLEGLAEPRKDF